MRVTTLFNKLLRLQGLRVTGIRFEDHTLVLEAAPRFSKATCPRCGKRQRCRALGSIRRWRHLGIWGWKTVIEAPIRRFRCSPCGSTVTELVPWARHDSDFTRRFEDAVGLMAQRTDKTTVSQLFGISWTTVGRIAERLVAELLDPGRLSRLRRIGVDEISFRKRHRYLTIVSDHDTGDVVWAGEGMTAEVLKGFFRSLPQGVCEKIEIVTMDMSQAYRKAVRECLPNATIAFDHFHIAKLANEALHEVRREIAREMREHDPDAAGAVKGLRWPLAYGLGNLPDKHLDSLAVLRPSSKLGRAYLLKEGLLDSLRRSSRSAVVALRSWTEWASRSRLQPFVRLGRTIREHFAGIRAFLEHRVTNARAEGINNKVRLLSHRAYGFHSAKPLIATIYLCCGGLKVPAHSQLC